MSRCQDVGTSREGLGFKIPGQPSVDWSSSSRFKNGSLLCLGSGGSFYEDTIVVATVLRVLKNEDKNQKGSKNNKNNCPPQPLFHFSLASRYCMIESPVFFEAYRPMLRVLQDLSVLSSRHIPMAELFS